MKDKKVIAIILAAGQGKRMAADRNKQYLDLAGKTVLAHTLEVFEACAAIDGCIVVAKGEECDFCRKQVVAAGGFRKVLAVVAGGAERQDSVYQGLVALPADCGWVVVHDGARPLVSPEVIENAIAQCEAHCATVVGVRVKDTIKVVDAKAMVLQTPPRETLWAVQTPQVFAKTMIWEAYEKAMAQGFYGTDDASVVEYCGGQVKMVQGSYENIKLTTAEDLLLAESILCKRQKG